jgi:hypothetical protein
MDDERKEKYIKETIKEKKIIITYSKEIFHRTARPRADDIIDTGRY